MTLLNFANSHYVEYKERWDALPDDIKARIDSTINNDQTTFSREFNLGRAMGFNTALEHALTWVLVTMESDPDNLKLLGLKDIISWTLIRLFITQYELTLLENPSLGSVN